MLVASRRGPYLLIYISWERADCRLGAPVRAIAGTAGANMQGGRAIERESYAKRSCVDLKRGVMGRAPWCKNYTVPLPLCGVDMRSLAEEGINGCTLNKGSLVLLDVL
jgi:hypothetical protein